MKGLWHDTESEHTYTVYTQNKSFCPNYSNLTLQTDFINFPVDELEE